MPESDFSSNQLSGSNWEVYQDVFVPRPTRQRARAWERAPVPAQAPRLQGQRIWKRAGTRSQTGNGRGNDDAQAELEREGAGARKKLRVMGAKENIGNAPWMEAQDENENICATKQLVKDLAADLPAHNLEPDALQFVPRKRTNINHVITPRKPLRQTTLNGQAQTISPNKSLKSPNEKQPRKRKSLRKSTRRLTQSDLQDASSSQPVVEEQSEGLDPVSAVQIPDASDVEVEPKLLISANQSGDAYQVEGIPESTRTLEPPVSIPEEAADENKTDHVEEVESREAEGETTLESLPVDGGKHLPEVVAEVSEDSGSIEQPLDNAEDASIQNVIGEQSEVATEATEEVTQSVHSPAGLTEDTISSIDTTTSSSTEAAETQPPSPDKMKMLVLDEANIRKTTPKRRRTLNDIIAAENESKIAIKTPKSAKRSAEVVKAMNKSRPSSGKNLLRRSMRTTRSSAVNSEQSIDFTGQPEVAQDVRDETVQATTSRSENIEKEIASDSNIEPNTNESVILANSADSESEIKATAKDMSEAEVPVIVSEDMTTETHQILSGSNVTTEQSLLQPELSEESSDQEIQAVNDKEDVPSDDLVPTDAQHTADEPSAENLSSSPNQAHLDAEIKERDCSFSDASDSSLLDFSPEITRTLHFDLSPPVQEAQVEDRDLSESVPEDVESPSDVSEAVDEFKLVDKVVEAQAIEELEQVANTTLPAPIILESAGALPLVTPSIVSDDDTEMLLKFLTRVQAKKAAKAEESPKKRRSLPHSPLRLPLGDTETNLSSPPNDQAEEIELSRKSSSPVKKRKRGETTMEDHPGADSKIRRSGRTRLPVKTPPPGAPSFIPMRRAGEGDGTVTLKRSEERDLATLTRVNTRKNKGGALSASAVLAKKAQEKEDPALRQRSLKEVFDEKAKRGKTKAKTVVWAEELARFQDTSERKVEEEKEVEEKKKSAVRVGMRSKIALGMAVNGTPAPKRKSKGRL